MLLRHAPSPNRVAGYWVGIFRGLRRAAALALLLAGSAAALAQTQARAPLEWFWLEVVVPQAAAPAGLPAAGGPYALRGTLAMADGVTRSTWGWWPLDEAAKVAAARSGDPGPAARRGPYTTTLVPNDFREIWNALAAMQEMTQWVLARADGPLELRGHTLVRMRYGHTGGNGSRAYLVPEGAQTPAFRAWLARVLEVGRDPAAAATPKGKPASPGSSAPRRGGQTAPP
jgi:hypothetical protein